MSHIVTSIIKELNPQVDFWSARVVDSHSEEVVVRQNVLEPTKTMNDQGLMITVCHKGGLGYAATSDMSRAGLAKAFAEASKWADIAKAHMAFDLNQVKMPAHQGHYKSQVKKPWESLSFKDRIGLLMEASTKLKNDDRIVDWHASLWNTNSKQLYFTSNGAQIEQDFTFLVPSLAAVANKDSNTQFRSLHGVGLCRQSGLETLDEFNLLAIAPQIANEAVELLLADNCPSGPMDLLLDADQMLLQIHESIGHPIELDRILGDERNYAGTSFVTLDMFGQYQYGSPLLNVTFDPTVSNEQVSYAYDDDGAPAQKEHVIKDGKLIRPLGGLTSQARSKLDGVANSRASNWNRPPMDRMANLNVEPGDSSFEDMIKGVEKGVYMKANTSWSIDDSRNKFQFGCEWARLIENGKLTKVVRNPNYRGISESFWRSLKKVGDKNTVGIYGSPYCGKGEPNQCVRVGHASPACLFSNVDVFGGAA